MQSMMTWQDFPLTLLKRSSNKLEAARGRPRLACTSPSPSHSKAGLKANKSGSSSQSVKAIILEPAAPSLLSLCLLTTKPAADMQHPWDLQTAEGPGHWAPVQRTLGHLWSVQWLQRWHRALSWPGQAALPPSVHSSHNWSPVEPQRSDGHE